ncbi:class I SAM-dependent methyltransferase [Pedobacter sp.]|nr:class I SAM-dependent methyltransferase [Candidatus Saccharibacteria bacterium]
MKYPQLLSTYPIISFQVSRRELEIILSHLETKLADGASGAIVEFGCYTGTTSLFIRRLLDAYQLSNDFHVYDSFEGLPEKTKKDQSPIGLQFRAGELSTSKKSFIATFKKAGLRTPRIHRAWFNELADTDIPNDIMFAFLDGDYYESVMTSLVHIWPKLASGAVIIVDDYANEALPGAKRAVDEWIVTHAVDLRVESSLAILQFTNR